jgi:hypothetical protein
MPALHKEILTEAQKALLPLVKASAKEFGLVGGTAVALHIGHRESIDFDLFTKNPDGDFDIPALKRLVRKFAIIETIVREKESEFTFKVNGVQITYFNFPHTIPYAERFGSYIAMPSLLTLAAMKAYALGARAKWKDYVDLYFIMREAYSLPDIALCANTLFGGEFNEKLFRTQLSFFDDVNYTEEVTYLPGHAVPDEDIKRALAEWAVE